MDESASLPVPVPPSPVHSLCPVPPDVVVYLDSVPTGPEDLENTVLVPPSTPTAARFRRFRYRRRAWRSARFTAPCPQSNVLSR